MDYDLSQNLLGGGIPSSIPVRSFSRQDAREPAGLLEAFDGCPVLGVAVRLSAKGHVNLLALASPDRIYLLTTGSTDAEKFPANASLGELLGGSCTTVAGFEMAKLAIHIYNDLQCDVRGVDLSTLFSPCPRKAWEPSDFAAKRMSSDINSHNIYNVWDDSNEKRSGDHACLRAWFSARAAQSCIFQLQAALKVDTHLLNPAELTCLGRLLAQTDILDKAKPTVVESDFSHVDLSPDGALRLHNTRYRNHVRRSGRHSRVVMTDVHGREFMGRAIHAEGKETTIRAQRATTSGTFQRVRVVGREDLTNSERARNEFVLLVLRGERTLAESPFVRYIWFPSEDELQRSPVESTSHNISEEMNDSQRKVIAAMVSEQTDLIITHGPPGTGKTTTISEAVKVWDGCRSPVWIAAQSNVAVKNIAESLIKRDIEFKLLVSKEFYVEWHEHIYEKMQESIVRSDELPSDPLALERVLLGSNVVLCTLSTLSNPQLESAGVYNLIPVERLVIDEASQIDVFEYMHLFDKFRDLRKVCFFGDPKQLPPYGQDTASEMQSIFNIKQLRTPTFTYFLDTQYRMPVPLGNFISEEVYDKKLRSQHEISAMSSVAFVDVTKGAEIQQGSSRMNLGEVQTIVHLVRHYYQKRDFCVITPYDAQRAAIEKQLKAENLPWERVFNVDSFQGNEAQYVLLSVTRTETPGFLKSQNRVNVMLTRCKSGMVIVTNRAFLRIPAAQNTLLGKLARYWETRHGQAQTWIDWKLVAEGNADMPGAPAIRSLLSPAASPPTVRPLVASAQPVGRYVPPRHARIDEDPLESAFPNLTVGGAAKPAFQSCWNNPGGLSAVKNAWGASGSFENRTGAGNSRAGRTPSSSSQTWRMAPRDPFPALNGKFGGNLRGQYGSR